MGYLKIIKPEVTSEDIVKDCMKLIEKWEASDICKGLKRHQDAHDVCMIIGLISLGISGVGCLIDLCRGGLGDENIWSTVWELIFAIFLLCMVISIVFSFLIMDDEEEKVCFFGETALCDIVPESKIPEAIEGNAKIPFILEKYELLDAKYAYDSMDFSDEDWRYITIGVYIHNYKVDTFSFSCSLKELYEMTKEEDTLDFRKLSIKVEDER